MSSDAPTTTRDVLENLYNAFAHGDTPTVLAGLDPQITWTETAGGPLAGTYTGPNAVLENVFGPLGSQWEDFTLQPDEYVCDGDRAVVIGTYNGRSHATGRVLNARFAHSWQIRDGRVTRFEQITDTARWNDATA